VDAAVVGGCCGEVELGDDVGELHLVEGAGHMPWFDDPKGVAAAVTRFLAE
jgi:pimeloyl-ACP methyl ester carboxylesterase